MYLMIALTLLLHASVVVQGIRFFLAAGTLRDQDRHIVATTVAGSVIFLLASLSQWMQQQTQAPLTVGFAFFNALFYLGLINGFVQLRMCGRRGG